MADLTTSYPVKAQVKYASAQERLLQQIANQIERLTKANRPFILVITFDGERLSLWDGQKAGIF